MGMGEILGAGNRLGGGGGGDIRGRKQVGGMGEILGAGNR